MTQTEPTQGGWLPKTKFQDDVDQWMDVCFGATIKADMIERADRFIEEALELAQTFEGFGADRAHALVDYVFGRPTGERFQEIGGVMVTLSALCNASGDNMHHAAETELARVWTKVEQIRAKQAAKPTGSALPIAVVEPTPDAGLVARVAKALHPMAWDDLRPVSQMTRDASLRQARAAIAAIPASGVQSEYERGYFDGEAKWAEAVAQMSALLEAVGDTKFEEPFESHEVDEWINLRAQLAAKEREIERLGRRL